MLSLSVSAAHEGHHGDDQKSAAASSVFPRVTAQSDRYEVVGVLKNGKFSIFVDDAVSNQPVMDVPVQVTIGDTEAIEAERGPNGYTIPSPDLVRSGSTEMIFSINGGKGDDLLVDFFTPSQPIEPNMRRNSTRFSPMGTAEGLVFAGIILGLLFGYLRRRGRRNASYIAGLTSGACVFLAAAGLQNAGMSASTPQLQAQSDASRRLPDGTAFAAKQTQRLLDIRTATVEPGTARPAFNLIGRIIGDPNRSSIVQSIYGGRIVPNDGTLPRIGQKVTKGETLLRIEPYLPVADRTTISEKMGEIEQLIAVAETKIKRLRPLVERGAAPMGQLNDLETGRIAGPTRDHTQLSR